MMTLWRASLFLVLVALTRQYASADIVVENDLINPEDIYDFIVLQDSNHWWLSPNTTQYFCIMRGLWNPKNHPKKFPGMARMSNPIVYSSTKQWLPWLINRATTWGVEKIAEVSELRLLIFRLALHLPPAHVSHQSVLALICPRLDSQILSKSRQRQLVAW